MTAKKTLVIVDHPTYDRSNANRRLVEEMRKYPDDILIHNLQSAYPTGTIDVAKEHCLVDNSDAIIFQFPFINSIEDRGRKSSNLCPLSLSLCA